MTENRNTPFQIGKVTIPGRAIFAPMAGVSDLPFRLLCREQGAALVCMEMISAKAITYKNVRTAELMETSPEEAPVSLQLFGCEPEIMARACEMIEDRSFDILDINMGCPVHKVVSNGEGSALMKNPALIEKMVAAAVSGTSRPVTVKIRRGFEEGSENAVECALAGARKITVINGNETRGQELVSLLNRRTNASAVYLPWKGTVDIPQDADILSNATSIGLYPNTDQKPDINYDTIRSDMVVTDVIFNDPNSLFLGEAKCRGAKTVNGLGMLARQGALNFKLWTGVDAPQELMMETLKKEFGL